MKPLPKIALPGKPNYIKLAEDSDFFGLFRRIERRYDTCFLLESLGEESAISRHHIIGFDPAYTLRAVDNHTLAICPRGGSATHYSCDNPYYALRDIVPQTVISRRYAGGLVGYLGYDAINFFEPSLQVKHHPDFPPFHFGLYLDGLVYDQTTGEVFYYYYDEDRFAQLQQLMGEPPPVPKPAKVENLGHTMSRDAHAQAVAEVKEDIKAGLIFQCEVGFKTRYRVEGDKTAIYAKLRAINPSPHMYYMKFAEQVILGASPELLFRLRNGEMETFPLAGTTKRGADSAEDMQLARALLNDPKEIAEHNMLVDLHRNDLGRVARFGTVKVRTLMDIKRYSHVQHISSEIVGIIAEDCDMYSALAANFPAGTLTGAPKIEAMKIIDRQEPEGRGPYGGALGHFGLNGDCTFAIPIRSLFIAGESAYAQTSGGNVYDSNADDEYLEIERKLSAMGRVMATFEE